MSNESVVACFSDLEVIKASLLGQGRLNRGRRGSANRRWEKVWGVLWKGCDGWCISVWGRKQQWKAGGVPLTSTQLSNIKEFATTSVTDRDNVLRLQLVDGGEWVLACASTSVLSKWSDTLHDKLILHLQGSQTLQQQTNLHCDTKCILSGWVSDSDEDSPCLEEELRLMLLACPQYHNLPGQYSILVEENQLRVLQVGGVQRWWWTWSDVMWYCLGRDTTGWDRQWQLEMKIKESCTPGGCVFTWAGASLKRFYSLLCEFAPNAKVLSKDRGISVANDTLTEGQLQSWVKELFLVVLSSETDRGVGGRYWLSLSGDGLTLLEHVSKATVWEWSLNNLQEFTLESLNDQKRLVIKVGSGSTQGAEYCLTGEHIAMVFVALKELMRQMKMEPSGAVPEEYEGGVSMVISPSVRQGMKAVYHLTLTAAPKECSHLVGRYQATVSRDSLQLVSDQLGEGWSWQLEHIRRFSVHEKDSQLVIETGRRSCTGEGQFVFCGEQLRLLCLVLKELTALLCLVTRVKRTMVQIRERIVLRLRTAAPHELIESFPVLVSTSGPNASLSLGHCSVQIYCNELQFVAGSGEVVCHWAVENLNQVAMEMEGESGVPRVILSGTAHGLGTCSLGCTEAAQLYAILELLKEHHAAVPASQPHVAPPTVNRPHAAPPTVQHPSHHKADGSHIIHHVKNAHGQSVCQEDCRLVLEEAALKLLRLRDASPVWSMELSHLQGATVEGYTDGKGVLLLQTLQGSPHSGMQYLLLCQHPEEVFDSVLGYAEEYKGRGVVREQKIDGMRDSPALHHSTGPTAEEEEEEALQTDSSKSIVCCSRAWDEDVVSVAGSVNGISWSVATSGSMADGLTAQGTEYSLTLSTSAVPPSALSLMGCALGACPAHMELAVPAVAPTSSATSMLSEMSDEVFYSDNEQLPVPSSLNLALFRPPRSLTLSPHGSVDGSVFTLYGNHGDEVSSQLPNFLQNLMEERDDNQLTALHNPEGQWEVQEVRITFSEPSLHSTAPQYTQRVCVVIASHHQSEEALSLAYNLGRPSLVHHAGEGEGEEEYWLHDCGAVVDTPNPGVTQVWSVDCPCRIGVELEGGLASNPSPQLEATPMAPCSVKQQAQVSTATGGPSEFLKGAWQGHLAYMTEVLWVWFGELQSLSAKQTEEEEELCFRLQWEDPPVVTCQAHVVIT